jgi:hypothetical protein
MTGQRTAPLYIWDLDRPEARFRLRVLLRELGDGAPSFRALATRSRGRFAVHFFDADRYSRYWQTDSLEALAGFVREYRKHETAVSGDYSVEHCALPDIVDAIRAALADPQI